MSEHFYWIIDYKISFCSDFHIGAGISLLGGNLHGLRLGVDGFPYMEHTEVRGLMRLGGLKLKGWQPDLERIFFRNFGNNKKDLPPEVFWTYTSARYPQHAYVGAKAAGILTEQSHIKVGGIDKNLYSYQKAGAAGGLDHWTGRIYSVNPALERDVAFLIACMRVEDRIGHRRTRGYGKVCWEPAHARRYSADSGVKPEPVQRTTEDWLDLILSENIEETCS